MSIEDTYRDNQLNNYLDSGERSNAIVESIFDMADDVEELKAEKPRSNHYYCKNINPEIVIDSIDNLSVFEYAQDNQDHYL